MRASGEVGCTLFAVLDPAFPRSLDMSSLLVHGLLGFLISSTAAQTSGTDYSQYVNPLIGSEGPFEGLAFGGGGK